MIPVRLVAGSTAEQLQISHMNMLGRESSDGEKMALQVFQIPMACRILRLLFGMKKSEFHCGVHQVILVPDG